MVNIRAKPLPDKDYLWELFDYSPETGELHHKPRGLDKFNTFHAFRVFESCYSGKLAGTIETLGQSGKSYVKLRIDGKYWLAHRVIWKMMTGFDPYEIDHEDGNGTNNRWYNLRNVDSGQNARNHKLQKSSTTRHTGVYWRERDSCYQADITVNGKRMFLGNFKEIEDAVEARNKAQSNLDFAEGHGTNRGYNG